MGYITDQLPVPQNPGLDRWPAHDNYNQYFTSLNDYSDYIHAQLSVIPQDFDKYQVWIKDSKNQVIIADIADAAGFLIRHGSNYVNTEAMITQAALSLETNRPRKEDYDHLLASIFALWPEPDNYDAGFTTADQYMNFIKSMGVPANDPDFQNWIQAHRQNLGDIEI